MLKGDIFIKRVYRSTGRSVPCKYVKRVCDDCGHEEDARYDAILKGRRIRGDDTDYCKKCSVGHRVWTKRGQNHGGFRQTNNRTYYKTINTEDGRRMALHRYLYEKYLGRKLETCERVHHIDLDKQNNDLENLFLCSTVHLHNLIHDSLEKCGFLFFENSIWFDREKGRYSTSRTEQQEGDRPVNLVDFIEAIPVKSKNERGNYYVRRAVNGKMKEVHIHLIEEIIGRKLFRDECVHHIDGNKYNNVVENLCLMTKKQHRAAHWSMQDCAADLLRKGLISFDRNDGVYFVLGKRITF